MITKCSQVIGCFFVLTNTKVFSEVMENGNTTFAGTADQDMAKVKEYGAFYNFNDTISVFAQKKYESNTKIKNLLRTFRRHCPFEEFIPMSEKKIERRFPFIVVEGIPRNTRNIVTKKLARKVRGRHVFTPPAFMLALGESFNITHRMRRAYFTLAVYGTACEIENIIKLQPVVTTGYWIDQTAFSIVLAYPNELPPVGSSVYQWPVDLLAPDIIFFVNPPITIGSYIGNADYKNKKTDIFRRWKEPKVIEINTTRVYNEIVNKIIHHLNSSLEFTFDY